MMPEGIDYRPRSFRRCPFGSGQHWNGTDCVTCEGEGNGIVFFNGSGCAECTCKNANGGGYADSNDLYGHPGVVNQNKCHCCGCNVYNGTKCADYYDGSGCTTCQPDEVFLNASVDENGSPQPAQCKSDCQPHATYGEMAWDGFECVPAELRASALECRLKSRRRSYGFWWDYSCSAAEGPYATACCKGQAAGMLTIPEWSVCPAPSDEFGTRAGADKPLTWAEAIAQAANAPATNATAANATATNATAANAIN
jgi:hypothetical protein